MKAKLLKEKLGETRYTVSDHFDCIAVGSPLCSQLISVDKETLHLKYALDHDRRGRDALTKKRDGELLRIWDTLQLLIDSGEITEIIRGDDEPSTDAIPVYFFDNDNGVVKEYAEQGEGKWPNCTNTGRIMYDNATFRTAEAAAKYGIEDRQSMIENLEGQIEERRRDIEYRMQRISHAKRMIGKLKIDIRYGRKEIK